MSRQDIDYLNRTYILIKFLIKQHTNLKFKKFLFSWQRYDHFSVLAELFPVGIPSLAVNLLTSLHGFFNESIQTELYEKLDCVGGARQTFVDLTNDPYLWEKMGW